MTVLGSRGVDLYLQICGACGVAHGLCGQGVRVPGPPQDLWHSGGRVGSNLHLGDGDNEKPVSEKY